eukprot:305324-Rhodomonas_salina.1
MHSVVLLRPCYAPSSTGLQRRYAHSGTDVGRRYQVLPVDCWVACEDCGRETLFRDLRPSSRRDASCLGCYNPMVFGYGGIRLVQPQGVRVKGAAAGAAGGEEGPKKMKNVK